MIILATAGGRGKVIQANMTVLTEKLDLGAGTMKIENDIFLDNDVVTIGEEDILITSHGLTCSITRAQNDTQDADHASGQEVQKTPGVVLVSHQFDGAQNLSLIRCSGNAEARFGVSIDGVLKYQEGTSYVETGKPFPCVQHKPGVNVTYTIYVWLKRSVVDEAVFWGEIQSY